MPNLNDWIGTQPAAGATTDPLRLTQGQSQPSYLDRYMQDRQKRVEEIDQMSPIRRFFGPNAERQDLMLELVRGEDMKRKQATTQLQAGAEARKAQTDQWKQALEFVNSLVGTSDKFFKMSEAAQAEAAPAFIEAYQNASRGLVDPGHIQKAFTVRDFARQASSVVDPLMDPEKQNYFQQRFRMTSPDQHGTVAKEAHDYVTERARTLVTDALPLMAQKAGASPQTPRPAADVIAVFRKEFQELAKSPALVREVTEFLRDDKNAGVLAQYGVIPPKASAAGAVQKETDLAQTDPEVTAGKARQKAAMVIAEADAKLKTPQGRADLRKLLTEIDNAEAQGDQTRAQTAKTKLDTLLATIKTIPAAGGALVDVSGAIGQGGTVAQSPAAGDGGATGAPGVRVISQTPGPPATSEVVKDVVRGEKIEQALTRIQNLQNDATLKQYVGPKTSRPMGAFVQAWQQNAPGGKLPDNFVRLQQSAGELKNFLIQEITGAAVRPDEEPRIMAEAPDITADKWDAFWQKYKQTLETVKIVNRRKKELYGPDGRLKVGADPDAVAKKHPLPKAADTKPGQPGSPFQPVTR